MVAATLTMSAEATSVPLIRTYQYARAVDTACTLARVSLDDGDYRGRGEGSPFESFFASDATSTVRALTVAADFVNAGGAVDDAIDRLTDAPARNALEAAWLDLRAKREHRTVAQLLGIPAPTAQTVMTTIAMDALDVVAADLERTRDHPLLKLKLGADDDRDRIELARTVRPDARLTVDVNAGWTAARFIELLPTLVAADIEMVEQPLTRADEHLLTSIRSPIPVVADESFSDASDLDRVSRHYNGVNVKLDKCGGLTAALSCIAAAGELGLRVMVGCLPASSLSTAVGMHAAQFAEWIDLDNHLWMDEDVQPAIGYRHGTLTPPTPELWG
ncbi:enolase C-terminal domain-like protein [Nocardia inohanensis]|uniref:enolase C-terminal domain-like protein n=1 Tax=Nocardia inohanensis TaxID=209246 RepID=UPI00082B9A90|nr:enolase C-terminal domain-like protein [Nocardia inohanensis]